MVRLLDEKKWKEVKVGEVLMIISPHVKELKTREYFKSGKFPIIDQGQDFIVGYSDKEESVFSKHLPVIIFGDHTRIIKYVDFPFIIGSSGAKIIYPIDDKNNDVKFLYYAIQQVRIPEKAGGYARHSGELLEQTFRIPSDIKEQKRIAEILSTIDKKLELQKARKEKIERVKKGLMDELLTGKKRVNVEKVLEERNE